MHVWSLSALPPADPNPYPYPNWNWVLQFVFTAFILGLGFFRLLRSTTSKYLVVDADFHSSSSSSSSFSLSSAAMTAAACNAVSDSCAVCGKPTSKQCAACKVVKYCSQTCQSEHWKSEHKMKCKEIKLSGRVMTLQRPGYGKRNASVALVPSSGPDQMHKLVDKVLFPYDEFVQLFNWDNQIFPPCGLLNCGNSCFANVVLQCLAHTRPLLAYLLDKGHRRDCRRNEWCFLCELQMHMERASRGQQPFSPINILSRLPSIGGNLGYGKQEDAHEFMRFAVDTMQSVCLDEHGGEKVIHPKSQETTLIQHIFGGRLQSQVICTQCNKVSNQYENMMDLTVEIQGDATSLEECLDQFTMKEWLHGENMYKCDGCNDYVRAWKCLTIHQAPNILTIALKRFQSGRFGKINKRITFPESLDLSPYISEGRDGTDTYKLYAVVVHVDMLNASFFGHYICYTKGFQGDWYRIDDYKVIRVELDEVLSQGAYMLMYSRVSARPTYLRTFESATKQQQEEVKVVTGTEVEHSFPDLPANSSKPTNSDCSSGTIKERLSGVDLESVDGGLEDSQIVNPVSDLPVSVETLGHGDCTSKALTTHRVCSSSPSCSCELSSSEIPDMTGSSALSVNASSDTSYKASGVASVLLEEINGPVTVNGFPDSRGKLGQHRSNDEPSVAGNTENYAGEKRDRKAAALDKTTPCEVSCFGDEPIGDRNDSEMNHVSVSSMDYEQLPYYMELDHVKIEADDHCSGAMDGTITNVSAKNICLDPSEKSSCVQDNDSCISNGHCELSSQ